MGTRSSSRKEGAAHRCTSTLKDAETTVQGPRIEAAISWDAFLATYLPALILALGTGVALPAIPTLARSFGVSFGVASFVITVFLLGNLAGTIPSGWLIDRFGRRPVMLAGPLLTATMGFFVAGAHSFLVCWCCVSSTAAPPRCG